MRNYVVLPFKLSATCFGASSENRTHDLQPYWVLPMWIYVILPFRLRKHIGSQRWARTINYLIQSQVPYHLAIWE